MASDTNGHAAAHHQFDARDALAKLGVEVERLSEQHQEITASLLELLYPDRVIVKESDQDAWRKQLWSLHQQAAKPILIFQPTCAKEVAVAVVICREAKVNFAVKSGGHAAMKNASSADGGVVIDLRHLDGIELNDEKTIAGIGPGNTWAKVFDKLSEHGLAVAGGRAGDVGVGGYTLGGGISFFASTRGWACDNIRNYELVTASGQILNVNYESHLDLFWALRGGGSNYGICTRFDYETFPQGDIYAGSLIIDYEHKDAVTEAFASFALDSDPRSAAWLTVVYYSGKKMFSSIVMHAEPTADFDMLKAYSKIPVIHQTHQVRSISDMTQQIAKTNVQGHHQNYQNTTFKFEPDFVRWLCEMYMHEIEPVQDRYESKQPVVMVLQYYTKESISYMHREGGNCLPLKEDEAPYLNLLTPSAWLHEKDNNLVMGIISKIHESAKEEGKKRGLLVDYVYMNYGSYTQDVLQSYGKENYERLKQIAEKYDPDAIFQNLMPGYFKFGGSPQELKDSKKVE